VSIPSPVVRSSDEQRQMSAPIEDPKMTQYLLSVHSAGGGDQARDQMTDEELRQGYEQVHALEDEMKAAGAWVFGGRLSAPDTATVVRTSAGKVMTTDGPFLESKEVLGGFYIIEAANLDAALAWASKTSELVNMPIEVRPFWDEAAP
jgi:hypothetical protein